MIEKVLLHVNINFEIIFTVGKKELVLDLLLSYISEIQNADCINFRPRII